MTLRASKWLMSAGMKRVLVVLVIAVIIAGISLFVWKRWSAARKTDRQVLELLAPDPRAICTLVCVNKTDTHIDALELKYSGKLTLLNVTTGASSSSADFTIKSFAAGGEARIPVGLKPAERRWCTKFVGNGQLDEVAPVVGDTFRPQVMNEKLTAGETLVLTFEPDGKVSVTRE